MMSRAVLHAALALTKKDLITGGAERNIEAGMLSTQLLQDGKEELEFWVPVGLGADWKILEDHAQGFHI